jgi:anti-anti-sigma factor
MMTAEKILRSDAGAIVGKVSARIEAAGQEKMMLVKLEGVLLLDQAKELQTFLESLLSYPSNRWILQLHDLNTISLRCLIVLVKFAKAIRKRGYEVEITSINPIVFEMLKDLQSHSYFSWKLK